MYLRLLFLLFFVCLIGVQDVRAQSIVRVQELDFGEAVVRRNDATYSMTVLTNGNLSAGTNFLHLTGVTQGIYRLTGATPNRPITVGITVDQQMIAPGEAMIIDNFSIDAPATTDGSGEALIRVGARVSTDASGTPYMGNSNFLAQMTLTVTIL